GKWVVCLRVEKGCAVARRCSGGCILGRGNNMRKFRREFRSDGLLSLLAIFVQILFLLRDGRLQRRLCASRLWLWAGNQWRSKGFRKGHPCSLLRCQRGRFGHLSLFRMKRRRHFCVGAEGAGEITSTSREQT